MAIVYTSTGSGAAPAEDISFSQGEKPSVIIANGTGFGGVDQTAPENRHWHQVSDEDA